MPRPSQRLALILHVLLAAACNTERSGDEITVARADQALISDQLHNAGTPGFYFLAPLVPEPQTTGVFEPRVSPEVRIHRIDPSTGASLENIATFTAAARVHGEKLRRHTRRGFYIVRWHTDQFDLDPAATYRIGVFVGGKQLGFADVDVVESRHEYRHVNRDEFVPLKNGRTLPIKFRIEKHAVDQDGDGVFDGEDNCPTIPNPPVVASPDRQPTTSNPSSGCDYEAEECDPEEQDCNPPSVLQTDTDGDGKGDACECLDVVCGTPDACYLSGTCEPTTGACTRPLAPDGTACDDGNACTRAEACRAGLCVGGDSVLCAVADSCHSAGECDPASGECSNPVRPDGSECDDGDSCTGNDLCEGGTCRPGSVVVTDDGNPCTVDTCDAMAGVRHTPEPDFTECSDGDACNGQERCMGGTCLADVADGPVTVCPGGSTSSQLATIHAPPGVLESPTQFDVNLAAMPAGLPPDFRPVGDSVEVTPVPASSLALPVAIGLHYDDSIVSNESDVFVMHYTPEDGWGFIGRTALDAGANTVTIRTRQFSTFVPVVPTTPPPQAGWTSFDPAVHGWPILNFGGPFFGFRPESPAHCFGMTSHALWFWRNVVGRLRDAYATDPIAGAFSIAEIAAMQAQFAEQGLWDNATGAGLYVPEQALVAGHMKAQIGLLHSPVLLVLLKVLFQSSGPVVSGGHSVIAYGYSGDAFQVLDPDLPQPGSLTYSPQQGFFDAYRGFNYVLALPTAAYWSLNSDHYTVWRAATANEPFGTSPAIRVDYPGSGQIVRETTPTLNIDLSLGSGATGFAFSNSRSGFAAFTNGTNQPQAWSWTPPREGRNELLLLAGNQSVTPMLGAALIRRFVVCNDPQRPVWNAGADACEACPAGESWDGTSCVADNCQVFTRLLVADASLDPWNSLVEIGLRPDGNMLAGYQEFGSPPSSQPLRVVFVDKDGPTNQTASAGYRNGIRPAPVFDVASDGRVGLPVTILPPDSGGALSMTYFGPVGSDTTARVADPVDSILTQGDRGFAFAPGDIPSISYMRTRPSTVAPGLYDVEVRLAQWDPPSATWMNRLVEAGPWIAPTASTAMDMDLLGNAHLTYVAWPLVSNGQGGWTTDSMRFMYARVASAGGVSLTQLDSAPPDGSEIAGSLSDIGVDALGRPHIAYVNVRNSDELGYSGPQGNVTLESVSGTVKAVSVALDGTGRPFVAFVGESWTGPTNGLFVWSRNTDGHWVRSVELLDPEAAGDAAAIVDGGGTLRVVYVAADGLRLASRPVSCFQ